MITEKRLEDALKFLSETDEQNAEANANVKYLDRLLKRKKALYITGEASLKSVSAKEQAFYASDTYKDAVEELFQEKFIESKSHLLDDELTLFSGITKHLVQTINDKNIDINYHDFVKAIHNIYEYSSKGKNNQLDKPFIEWFITQKPHL